MARAGVSLMMAHKQLDVHTVLVHTCKGLFWLNGLNLTHTCSLSFGSPHNLYMPSNRFVRL